MSYVIKQLKQKQTERVYLRFGYSSFYNKTSDEIWVVEPVVACISSVDKTSRNYLSDLFVLDSLIYEPPYDFLVLFRTQMCAPLSYFKRDELTQWKTQ